MSWQNDETPDTLKWPTWSTRLNWAMSNYQRKEEYDVQWKLQKFLMLVVNLTALANLIERETNEQLLTPKERAQYQALYESYRPTQPSGRPKNGSGTGPTV